MNISKKSILLFVFATLAYLASTAQTQKITKEEYIDRYKSIAVAHMERYGIPASITMSQGLLESGAGNSWLSRSSNNHFGIKCKKNWTGDKVYHDDDAKGECFRAYPSVEESYRDHATFLDAQPRYDVLFTYRSDDYKKWAHGLKACGYATAPDYAEKLIKMIEDNKLFLLDQPNGERLYAQSRGLKFTTNPEEWFAGHSSVENVSASGREINPDQYRVSLNVVNGYSVYDTNGVHYVLAKDGDTFENIGKLFMVSPRNLRRFNDLRGTEQPMPGEVVYIERKKRRWQGDAMTHIAREGETAYAVGQSYAIRTRSVEKMNRMGKKSTLQKDQKVRIR